MSTETAHDTHSFYVEIWAWLVGLLILGTIVVFLPIPKITALVVVFAIAVVKAALVVRNYMHLRGENLMIYLIAALPVLLIIGMIVTLLPDIAFRR
jgi:caa(3)-type oxidase subunit IV